MKFFKAKDPSLDGAYVFINPAHIVSVEVEAQTGKCGTDYWVRGHVTNGNRSITSGPYPSIMAAALKAERMAAEIEAHINKS